MLIKLTLLRPWKLRLYQCQMEKIMHLEELISDVITPIRLKKIFMPEEGFGENGFYKGIDDKVVSF